MATSQAQSSPPASGGAPGPAAGPPVPACAEQRRWSSTDLFGGSVEIEIEHGASVYRLRRTALGKLILTK
jgi:hemin uptake protein HemP